MNSGKSRRDFLCAAGIAATWPIKEGAATPKLCMISNANPTERSLRRMRQIGIEHVVMSGPRIPWDESDLRAIMERHKSGGVTVFNMMISGFPNTIYGRPGRDAEIENVQKSIRAAGRAGLPIVEYNFYAHRAMEGYFNEEGRAGSGVLSFDYSRMKNLPPLPEEGAHPIDEMWSNVAYFLKAVVPVAKEANVRLALHPNDPPAPESRGSGQIMGSVEGWKRLVEIVPSPHNGITFDCGVTREMGQNPVEVCRYFSKKDCINHVHFRNVRMKVAREKYTEVFPDEGEVDMFGVMKELVRNKYPRLIYPEHPRGLDADREPGAGQYAGWTFNVAYARAMLQAALESR
ncbi:MAG TPA: mannonate dehydratase [Candidatus Sulfopaludibacter sp.]|jgi:mannonate dehydratase|nr:mannonate dehydratase [Candidatus Sulfopaludibacter sp.]